MTIRRMLFAAIICCVATGSMNAQSTRTRSRAKPAMWTALQLTESQKAQVKAIHDKYAPATRAAQKIASDSAARINAREMTDVRAILTSSQQEIFDSYMSGRKRPGRSEMVKMMPAKIAVPR